jgi:hypothetical protein
MRAPLAGAVGSPPADPFGARLFEALLIAEPRLRDAERQAALTERFLIPDLAGLEALFLAVRAEVDADLQPQRAVMAGKPYPLGQCLGVTKAVRRRLGSVAPARLAPQAGRGYAALVAFLSAGGAIHTAWGDLRGEYFQNALLIGALYVDVSNDTVVATKPKVEIRPFAAANFSPIADYRHYGRIAARYWGQRIFPNHLLPELAPYLPLIQLGASGGVSLGTPIAYMLGLTLSRGFTPSEAAIEARPMPGEVFGALAAALRGGSWTLARDPEEGRARALACCGLYRAEGRQTSTTWLGWALQAARDINARLAALTIEDRRAVAAA